MKAGLESGIETGPGSEIPPTVFNSRFQPPPPNELAPLFPNLEILELLGKGGMGAVYRARQPGLDRLVAVKILPPELGTDPAFAERFTREARALARLSHQNIVSVFDFGHTDGLYYFIMEFVDGANIRQLIQSGKLEPEAVLKIIPQICEALQFAHDEGIVHRDIKPENILLNKQGRVKIADFGLAKLVGASPVDHTLTHTGQVMGTLHYMAPEQLRGSDAVDHRADIYALGVVFYELLTGQLPLGFFEPPSKRVQVDVRLDEVVLRALESEPNRRYQKANDVKTDVDAISSTSSVTSRSAVTSPNIGSAPAGQPSSASTARRIFFYLAGAMLAISIVLFGVWLTINDESDKIVWDDATKVLLKIPIDAHDPSLSFMLDRKPIHPALLLKPLELRNGQHELIVNKNGKLLRRYRFEVPQEVKEAEDDQDSPPPTPPTHPTPPPPLPPSNVIENSIGMKLVRIPAGEFLMGSPDSEPGRYDNEGPVRPIKIPEPFYMGMLEVTQAQFEKVTGTNPSHFVGDELPVGWVQWKEAKEFCRKLSDLPAERAAGRAYRLPFEPEWEYACRAGTTTPFHYGQSLSGDQANFSSNHPYGDAPPLASRGQTAPVGSYEPNDWKLFDMHGNAPEWCEDLLDGQNNRVIRGGGWNKSANRCRCAYRAGDYSIAYTPRHDLVGFRVVMISHVGPLPDFDRLTVEWALGAGFGKSATVAFAGQTLELPRGAPVPADAFSIVRLDLSESDRAGDTVLGRLSRLRELRELNLSGTPVSDMGLEHLKNIKSLRRLQLRKTQVTPAGLRALKLAIPGCTIESGS